MATLVSENAHSCQSGPSGDSSEPRRGFFAKAAALVVGLGVYVPAAIAGLVAYLNPLREKGEGSRRIRLTTLDSLPEDGTPRKFSVVADRSDAWTRYPNEPIGAVYLRRIGPDKVEAVQVVCPHAGCFITYDAQNKKYYCPCHSASFALEGKRLDATSPSPRDLDHLEVEVDKGQVVVNFQKFRTGIPQKIAEA